MMMNMFCPVFAWRTLLATGPSFYLIVMLSALIYHVQCSEEPEVHCTMNKYKNVTCLWNQKGHLSENYTLYYWYGMQESSVRHTAPCPQYVIANHITIGCHFPEGKTFQTFNVKLNSSSMGPPIQKTFHNLQELVKMDPPANLSVVNTSSLELRLTWEQSLGVFSELCISYQVRHRSMGSDKWTVKNASSKKFSLPSFDPRETYTFYVRSQLNTNCISSNIWSEWSEGVTWGRNATVSDGQPLTELAKTVLISIISTCVLLLLLLLFIRMERIWFILVPQIPNPGRKFEALFNIYRGDFQEWLGVSKEAVDNLKPNYTEPLCTVSEDPDCIVLDMKNPTCN
ncbi:cytokine receptor common subunit gamma [Pseudophryne corroboree]|uniref:cytokine receptor common subunit gamma n=1 Tax=Pseudophryne corroboree TaxID=495146 RepID=UPI00308147F3